MDKASRCDVKPAAQGWAPVGEGIQRPTSCPLAVLQISPQQPGLAVPLRVGSSFRGRKLPKATLGIISLAHLAPDSSPKALLWGQPLLPLDRLLQLGALSKSAPTAGAQESGTARVRHCLPDPAWPWAGGAAGGGAPVCTSASGPLPIPSRPQPGLQGRCTGQSEGPAVPRAG